MARPIHPVAEEVITTRSAPLPDGRIVPANSFVSVESCRLLYELAERSGARQGVEIGMAFGVSTVCLADALRKVSGAEAKLISFDPTQRLADSWNSAGLFQVERAGLSGVVELRDETSQRGLPKLVDSGYRCQIGFIDGWHTFDHTLIDFFYIDQMLDIGGHIVFDDTLYPSIHSVVRFVLANRNYELAGVENLSFDDPIGLRARRFGKRLLRRVAKTDRDPRPEHAVIYRKIATAQMVGMRKIRDDDRRFDHYAPF
ncbi:MAG: class I SAM-dependent methyltransferase [Thermoanaerobaculia bacterium]